MTRGQHRPGGQRGASAVEFALLVPVLLLLVFGIIDFGMAIMSQSVVSNATREGVRAASLGASSSDIDSVVATGLSTLSGSYTISVTCTKPGGQSCGNYNADAVSGGTATVRVTYTRTWLTPLASLFGNTETITGVSEMRIE